MGLLKALLDTTKFAAVQYLENAGLEPFANAYVTAGKPAPDCTNTVVVWCQRYGQSDASLPRAGSAQRIVSRAVKSAVIRVDIIDCVTVVDDQGHLPSLQDVDSDAQRIYDRAEAIYSGFLCDIVRRTLWVGTSVAQETGSTTLSELSWDTPQGGAVVGHFSITTTLEGASPVS